MRRVSGYNLDEFVPPLSPTGGRGGEGGFNLAKMVVGSEGTLCVATEVKVNLVPRPTMTGLSVVHFADIFQASEAVKEILNHGPSSIEIMDKNVLDRSRQSMGLSMAMAFIQGDPGAILAVEFYGESEAELTAKTEGLKADMERRRLGYACVNLLDRASQANVWSVRKNGLGLLMSMHGDAKPLPFVEDTAVDPENMGAFVRQFDEIVRNHGTEAAYYGHASVGCLHIRPVVSLKDQAGLDKMYSIADEISDLVKEFGGSLSGEHGDGIVRGVWNEKMFGPEIYQMFRELKSTFDPDGIMNPGKIIDCPPMTGEPALRPRLPGRVPANTARFFHRRQLRRGGGDVQRHGRLPEAGGNDVPVVHRHPGGGTLHPGTGQPAAGRHVGQTPRRDNYQPAALRRPRPVPGMQGLQGRVRVGRRHGQAQVRVLGQLLQGQRPPRRNRIFGNIAKYSAWGSRLAPFSNWLAASPIGKLFSNHFLGVHPNPLGAGFHEADLPAVVPFASARRRSASRRYADGRPVERHLHELQLPRRGKSRRCAFGGRRLQGGTGRRPMLRKAHDLQGNAGRRRGQRRPQRLTAPRLRGAGHPHHRL